MMTPEKNKFSGAKKLLQMVLLLLIGLGFQSEGIAETLYVKKSGTKLQAQDSAKSEVIAKLGQGTPVKVIKKLKRFYQVSEPSGKKGWIFKFKLTSKAPASSAGGGGGFEFKNPPLFTAWLGHLIKAFLRESRKKRG